MAIFNSYVKLPEGNLPVYIQVLFLQVQNTLWKNASRTMRVENPIHPLGIKHCNGKSMEKTIKNYHLVI